MQDGGQDAAVGELDGYALYGHIQCGVAAAIGVVPPEPLSPIEPQRVPMKIIIFISLAATYSTKQTATYTGATALTRMTWVNSSMSDKIRGPVCQARRLPRR